jgi:hypothetical protein
MLGHCGTQGAQLPDSYIADCIRQAQLHQACSGLDRAINSTIYAAKSCTHQQEGEQGTHGEQGSCWVTGDGGDWGLLALVEEEALTGADTEGVALYGNEDARPAGLAASTTHHLNHTRGCESGFSAQGMLCQLVSVCQNSQDSTPAHEPAEGFGYL